MSISSGRSKITVALAIAALTVVAAIPVIAIGPAPAAAAVEDEGAGCPVTLPGSLSANSRLPDPFRRIDGTRITSRSDWRCRRAEIKELTERYVYGDKPAKPAGVTGTVSSSSITEPVIANAASI